MPPAAQLQGMALPRHAEKWIIRFEKYEAITLGIFKVQVQCFQPRRGATYQPRASAAASAAKRRPGIVVRKDVSPERAAQAAVDQACCFGPVKVVSPFQGFRFMPPRTQGGASLALG